MRVVIAVLAVLLLLLQYQLWIGNGGVRDVWWLKQAVAAQQRENEAQRQRNDALEAEVRDLKSGLEAVEERARRELGMIRDGEVFYQVVEEQ
jgi:cell division protein FtsB